MVKVIPPPNVTLFVTTVLGRVSYRTGASYTVVPFMVMVNSQAVGARFAFTGGLAGVRYMDRAAVSPAVSFENGIQKDISALSVGPGVRTLYPTC